MGNLSKIFSNLIIILQQAKNNFELRIKQNQANIKKKIQNNLDFIEDSNAFYEKVMMDIEKNQIKIVKNMELKAFEEVLNNYQMKIDVDKILKHLIYEIKLI
jgi:hypothetical protein